ncbi:MAG: indolepyruvate ferredoxin oxidoreductase subunit alpha [Candidatus Bathyarchaeia archaeon]
MVDLKTLTSTESGRYLLLGNEAIVRGAIEGGVRIATSYPGTPSSEIIDTLHEASGETGIYVEYSVNEKVALEVAAGAALCGWRALCSMKHVGLNVASDTFVTLAYTGVRGGLVLVSADDPSCWSSQNEQDNRYYARLANVPMLEPSNSQEAKDMTISALDLSEMLELPVILRSTTRVSHTLGPVDLGRLRVRSFSPGKFVKETERFVMVPRHALTMHDVLLRKMERALKISEESPYNMVIEGDGDIGVITSGAAYNYAVEALNKFGVEASILKLGMPYPPPSRKILRFMERYDKVFVVEELEPILETDVRSVGSSLNSRLKIFGKLTGHLPRSREYTTRIVYEGMAEALNIPTPKIKRFQSPDQKYLEIANSAPARPPVLCPGCPHRASFYLMKTVLGRSIVYCTDIGCYALGIQPPIQVGDILICMGASLGVACGVSRSQGETTVAIVGDSTFFHASIPALINAVYNNHRIIVVALDNSTTAMTGFQPHPGVPYLGKSQILIEDVAKGCGVKYVKVVDPFDIENARMILKEAMAFDGPSLTVMRRPCSIMERRQGIRRRPYIISKDRCDECLACIKTLGCPAFHIVNGKVGIDQVLCTGCGFCAKICPRKAIEGSR